MTKREMFASILAVQEVSENIEMSEFIKHQIELLDNRADSKKPTKNQLANEGVKNIILQVLEESNTPLRVKDLIADSRLCEYSSSKVTALLRQLLPETGSGQVVKMIEKKISYFSINRE